MIKKNLSDYRRTIDKIDTQILSLLDKRIGYVLEIGKIKSQLNLPITDKKREESILTQFKKVPFKNLTASTLSSFLKSIFRICKKIEKMD